LRNLYLIKPWNPFFKAFLWVMVMFFAGIIHSQNKINETISAEGISKILIDGNQIFNIEVHAVPSNDIEVFSLTDGEYQDYYKIYTEIQQKKLFIQLQKIPLNKIPDDERNAHKVVAATLTVYMPEKLDLSIRSDIGSVNATGDFNELNVQLFQGNCNIIGSAVNGTVYTFDGNILISTTPATIDAHSNNGTVGIDLDKNTSSSWMLKSVDGKIEVDKLNE